jgi:hypothetical protein
VTRLLVATAIAGALVAAGHAQSPEVPANVLNVVISGRVLSVETGAPLPHARIVIYTDATPLPAIFTDAQGSFASAPMGAGRYRLTASKSGYAPTTIPRIDPASPGGVDVRLERSASISGRVSDSNGEPVAGAAILVGIPRAAGSPTMVKTLATNDLGEYRAGGLAPGAYVVAVNQLSIDSTGAVTGGLVFFPGTPVPGDAQQMALMPGDQKGGIEFSVPAMQNTVSYAISSQLINQPGTRISVRPPASPDAPSGTSSIRGRVTRPGGAPIAHVNVTAVYVQNAGARNPVPPKSAMTDDDGRYEITELPRGGYRINATKVGFTGAIYGQQPGGDLPAPFAIGDNEIRTQVDITLPRHSAITGQVFDDFGDPIEGVGVTVSQIRFTDGRRRLTPLGTQQTTDDLGRYRVFGLPPGQYIVTATVGQLSALAGNSNTDLSISGFAPTYFPGMTAANEARQVAVGRSQDVTAIDIPLVPLPTVRIAGRKLGADGQPLGGSLMLMPSQRSGAIVTPPNGARIEQDGRFEFPNVTPGEYVIQADKGKASQAGEGEFVSQFVTVNGADVTNLLLQATPGSSISGRIVFDGDGDPPPLTFGVIPARADADRTPLNAGNLARAEVQRDLSFQMTGIHGPRRLMIDRRPSGWDLKAVIAGGVDVTDVALPFGSRDESLSDVQVVLTNRLTELSGTVANARGENVSDYALLVFSSDRERWYSGSRFLRRSGPQAAGNFTISGLPPGDYFVAAVPNTTSVLKEGVDAWQDPEFLESLTPRAARAALTDGQKLSISARMITP